MSEGRLKEYAIYGIVSKSLLLDLGGGKRVRVEFEGGNITSAGIRPAVFRTRAAAVQRAIEADGRFAGGMIVVRREEAAEEAAAAASAAAASAASAAAAGGETRAYGEVTNGQQARNVLATEYGVRLSELPNNEATRRRAQELGVCFPNWR